MNIDATLDQLAQDPSAPFDLAELSLELARDEYPDLDVEGYLSELEGMARDVGRHLGGSLESRTRHLCRYLFHDLGFHGNTKRYYDPLNSYLNEVLDRRTGLPITLSTIAMAVGNRAGLVIHGLGLPGHFLTMAVEGGERILFDPFHAGRLLTLEDCERLVEEASGIAYPIPETALVPVPAGAFAVRLLTNLKAAYFRNDDYERASRVIRRLCQLNPNDITQARDLGLSLLRAGRFGRAIDPLETYLAAAPNAADIEEVRRQLTQAQSEVSRWN